MDKPHSSQTQDMEEALDPIPDVNAQLIRIERRRSPRFPAVEQRAWTGWWINPAEYIATAAAVKDISRGGAKIMMAEPPEENEKLWIRLANSAEEACLEATVLEVLPIQGNGYRVRVEFTCPCPQSFHQAVTEGIARPTGRYPRIGPGAVECRPIPLVDRSSGALESEGAT